jgi:hypothetical protein
MLAPTSSAWGAAPGGIGHPSDGPCPQLAPSRCGRGVEHLRSTPIFGPVFRLRPAPQLATSSISPTIRDQPLRFAVGTRVFVSGFSCLWPSLGEARPSGVDRFDDIDDRSGHEMGCSSWISWPLLVFVMCLAPGTSLANCAGLSLAPRWCRSPGPPRHARRSREIREPDARDRNNPSHAPSSVRTDRVLPPAARSSSQPASTFVDSMRRDG